MNNPCHNSSNQPVDQGLQALRQTFFRCGGLSAADLEPLLAELPDQGKEIEEALATMLNVAEKLDALGMDMQGLAHSNETVCRLREAFKPYIRNLIEAQTTYKVLTATTGAAAAIPDILKAPAGASRILLNSEFPYSHGESDRYTLGSGFVDGAVKQRAAVALAASAFYQAMETVIRYPDKGATEVPEIIAASATASTATNRERRGGDHIWGAVRTLDGVYTYYAEFQKGVGQDDRDWQDALCNVLVTNSILAAAGLPQLPIMDDKVESAQLVENWGDVPAGKMKGKGRVLKLEPLTIDPSKFDGPGPFLVYRDGTFATEEELQDILKQDMIIYPGSFDVVHFGHEQAALTAYQFTDGKPVYYEISASNANADKEDVGNEILARRVVQNIGRHPTFVTRGAPFFHQKLDIFDGAKSYVAGYDIAKKIVSPDSYPGGTEEMLGTLQKLQDRGITIYVLGRTDEDGIFKRAKNLSYPACYHGVFQDLTGQAPISSTMLRTLRKEK